VLSVTFALVLLTHDAIKTVGTLDENYFVAFEDVDYCLRTWSAGLKVIYCPACLAVHLEGATRGNTFFNKEPFWLKKELDAEERFWQKWRNFNFSKYNKIT